MQFDGVQRCFVPGAVAQGKPAGADCAEGLMMGRKSGEERTIALAQYVDYADESIVSKTLLDKKSGSLTLFAFDKEQGLSEHTSPYDATVYVLKGEATLIIGGEHVKVVAGQMVVMPANVPHAVRAKDRFKMLLIMIR